MRKLRTLMAALLLLAASARLAVAAEGVLLLAHGAHSHGSAVPGPWNANVEALVQRLERRWPTVVAFGMADPHAIQAALNQLAARGVDHVAAVPLFVSSHSPIIGNFRYILGLQDHLAPTTTLKHLDRVSSEARLAFAGAMDAHPLISEIVLERALAAADDPGRTSVILIGHGPNDDEENRRWLRDLRAHADFLMAKGDFRNVRALTHRNDASLPVKAAAREEFRSQVARAAEGGPVVVVPVLLSRGGIEHQVEADLDGLAYRFAEPLLPHPNIERWVEAQVEALFERVGGSR